MIEVKKPMHVIMEHKCMSCIYLPNCRTISQSVYERNVTKRKFSSTIIKVAGKHANYSYSSWYVVLPRENIGFGT